MGGIGGGEGEGVGRSSKLTMMLLFANKNREGCKITQKIEIHAMEIDVGGGATTGSGRKKETKTKIK